MLRTLGVTRPIELVLFAAIIALVTITPLGKEATAPLVLLSYRLLLVAITIGIVLILKQHIVDQICPVLMGACAMTLMLMLISLAWSSGSLFDGLYRWYQHLLFGASFLALAALHATRSANWKRALLWAIIGVDVIYLGVSLITGARPVAGPFVNANYFASFLLVGFSGAVAIALFEPTRLARIVAVPAALFLYYGMTQAWSRGATLAAMGVVAVGVIRFAKKRGLPRAAAAIVVAGALIAAALLSPTLVRKFLDRGEIDPYNYQRPQLWMSALYVIQAHPILGVGFGDFYYASKRFSPPVEGAVARYLKRPAIAHNEFLQYAAECGIPAAILLFVIAGYLFRTAVVRARSCPAGQRVFQELGILTAIGLGTHALVDNNWTVPVMAAGLVAFSLADTLPLPSLRLRFDWTPRVWALCAILMAVTLFHGILLPSLAIHFNEAGHAAYERRDLPLAEANHRLAIAFAPNHDIFLDNAGMVYFDKFKTTNEKRWQEYAETLFTRAIVANPSSDTPAMHLEHLLIDRLSGDPAKDAATHLRIVTVDRHILEIDPFNPFVRKNLAEALYMSGAKEEAQQELERALELEPNYVPGYLRIADWYRDAGNLTASADYRQKAVAVVLRYQNFQPKEPYEAMLLGRGEGGRQ
jgi:O-antigen ligase